MHLLKDTKYSYGQSPLAIFRTASALILLFSVLMSIDIGLMILVMANGIDLTQPSINLPEDYHLR